MSEAVAGLMLFDVVLTRREAPLPLAGADSNELVCSIEAPDKLTAIAMAEAANPGWRADPDDTADEGVALAALGTPLVGR